MTANNPHNRPLENTAGIAPFANYLTASSLWLAGMSLQGFVVSWLLVGRVGASPEQVGWARSISEIIPLGLLLVGGVLADRINNRGYLVGMHLLVALPPLLMLLIMNTGRLSYWWIVAFSAALAGIQALSDPARQSVLSRLAPTDIQRTVTLSTIVTSLVAIVAVQFGGRIETLGDSTVLIGLALLFSIGLWPMLRVPSLAPLQNTAANPSFLSDLLAGWKAAWKSSPVRTVISCNFASSLFNAGAYVVAVPFIIRQVYAGDAVSFANVLVIITIGSTTANIVLLKLMPLARPGRIFLGFQLTRAIMLLLLWADFGPTAFYALMGLWGVNMGVTSTLARAIVQERATRQERARVLSLMLLSFMVAGAIGAPLLGMLVAAMDPLTALLPGVVVSVLIFTFGWASGLNERAAFVAESPGNQGVS